MDNRLWYEIHQFCAGRTGLTYELFWLWLHPVDGVIAVNKRGAPYGNSLRAVAAELNRRGHTTKTGVAFKHSNTQLYIFQLFPDVYAEMRGLTLDEKQRDVLSEAFREMYRQKCEYEQLTEEWRGRMFWVADRRHRKPTKRVQPWESSKL